MYSIFKLCQNDANDESFSDEKLNFMCGFIAGNGQGCLNSINWFKKKKLKTLRFGS